MEKHNPGKECKFHLRTLEPCLVKAPKGRRHDQGRQGTEGHQKNAETGSTPPRAPAVGMRAPALEASQEKLEEFLTSE